MRVGSNRLVPLPDLPLNGAFGVRFTHNSDAGAFTGLPLLLAIDLLGGDSGDRIELTEADATLSDADLTVTFAKDEAWVAANFVDGTYRGRLFVNGTFDSGFSFDAYIPENGAITP